MVSNHDAVNMLVKAC